MTFTFLFISATSRKYKGCSDNLNAKLIIFYKCEHHYFGGLDKGRFRQLKFGLSTLVSPVMSLRL